jgi:hypothetical protein
MKKESTMRELIRSVRGRMPVVGWIWITVWVFSTPEALADGGLDTALLESRMGDIDTLVEKIETGCDRAEALRGRLGDMRERLAGEIRERRRRHRITAYASACRMPRILNDLKLIRRIDALTALLEKKTGALQEAMCRLDHYRQRIRDDVMMRNTVGSTETDAAVEGIDRGLAACATAAAGPLLDVAELAPWDLEATWESTR